MCPLPRSPSMDSRLFQCKRPQKKCFWFQLHYALGCRLQAGAGTSLTVISCWSDDREVRAASRPVTFLQDPPPPPRHTCGTHGLKQRFIPAGWWTQIKNITSVPPPLNTLTVYFQKESQKQRLSRTCLGSHAKICYFVLWVWTELLLVMVGVWWCLTRVLPNIAHTPLHSLTIHLQPQTDTR